MAMRLQQEDELGSLSEINVTPLVDVMLVLLIIFMITMPMLTQGLEIELPGAEGRAFETATDEPPTISIADDGTVYLNDEYVGVDELDTTLLSMLRAEGYESALVRADKDVPYGHVIRVIDIMNRAGILDVGMVTREWEEDDAGRRR
ncbi:MAG: ExbD/TolR family protein [Thermoanaerobaculia bacterium]|nr:ExbD/TolR family protein [Thermoanaerobaculia bacterium]